MALAARYDSQKLSAFANIGDCFLFRLIEVYSITQPETSNPSSYKAHTRAAAAAGANKNFIQTLSTESMLPNHKFCRTQTPQKLDLQYLEACLISSYHFRHSESL